MPRAATPWYNGMNLPVGEPMKPLSYITERFEDPPRWIFDRWGDAPRRSSPSGPRMVSRFDGLTA